MLLSLDKLSLRDASSAAPEGGDRLPHLLKTKAGRIRDRTSDGDTEEEEEEEDDGDDNDDDKEEEDNGVQDGGHDRKGNGDEAVEVRGQSDEANFWAWRLRPAALCELRHYLAFRLAKAAIPGRTNAAPTMTKPEKRTLHQFPNLLRRLTCSRGIETEPLAPSTPPSTAPSSPAATKRPKSLAHRHCLRIRGSQARSLLTGPHPTLGQVFDPARVATTHKPVLPTPEVDYNEPLLKLNTSPQKPTQNLYSHKTTQNFLPPPSKNGSLSSETEPDSDVPSDSQLQFRPKPKPCAVRRPKGPPPPPPPRRERERQYGGGECGIAQPEVMSFPQTPQVRLLELPAHHQPLLHRYGLSQFVLVLDDHGAGSSAGSGSPISSSSSSCYRNPLRSVMRKPQVSKGSKKCVTFQEVTTIGNSFRPHQDPRFTSVGMISGR